MAGIGAVDRIWAKRLGRGRGTNVTVAVAMAVRL